MYPGDSPRTIHDFYGFPPELYRINYPCPGAPSQAETVINLTNHRVSCNDNWGIDHGTWSVLLHLYPEAKIPVFQLSLDHTLPPEEHYQLGATLSGLREKGVLCIGSGNMVHNLSLADFENMNAKPYPWVEEYDHILKHHLLNGNHKALINYPSLSRYSSLAVPTNEHYLPMLYILAMQGHGEGLSFVYEGVQNAAIAMTSFIIGEQAVSLAA